MAALAISFAAGILAASCCSPLAWLSLDAAIVLAAVPLFRRTGRPAVLIMGAVFAIGATWYTVRMQVSADDISRMPGAILFRGTIATDPDIREDYARILIHAQSAETAGGRRRVSGLVMLTAYLRPEQPMTLAYGDSVMISARPYAPFPPTNPGQFSWKAYLERQGIRSCATVRDPADIIALQGNSANPVVKFAFAAKHYLSDCVYRIHPNREAAVILGIVLGTYSYLPRTTVDSFSRTGTLHLLAASGFNCFILAFLATSILKRLRLTPKRITPITIALLLLYLIMVGPKASIVRATVMAVLWLLAMPLKRVPSLRNLFFTAALVTLAMNPSDLFDVGFQLSFAAVWALISSVAIIERVLLQAGLLPDARAQKRWRPAIRWVLGELLGGAVATIAVSLYTAPIIAYHFNYVSLVALPANIALALGVYVVTAIGLLSLVLAHVPCLGPVLGFFGTKVTDAMLAVVNYLGSGRYSAVTVASPGPLAIVGYYVLLYIALDLLRSKIRER